MLCLCLLEICRHCHTFCNGTLDPFLLIIVSFSEFLKNTNILKQYRAQLLTSAKARIKTDYERMRFPRKKTYHQNMIILRPSILYAVCVICCVYLSSFYEIRGIFVKFPNIEA